MSPILRSSSSNDEMVTCIRLWDSMVGSEDGVARVQGRTVKVEPKGFG